ncbi:MAG: hypothetical protein WC304_02580, partial [Candidatus Gracilibacteria bacterium]
MAERKELLVWERVESSDGIEAAANSLAIPAAQLHNLIQASLEKDLTEAEIFNLLPANNWVEAETLSLLSEALRWYKFAAKQARFSACFQRGGDIHWKEINQYLVETLRCCSNHDGSGADLLLALQIHQYLRIIRNPESADIPFILQNKQHLIALLQDSKFDLDFHSQTNPQLAKFIADLHAAGFDFSEITKPTREEFQTVFLESSG